MPTARSIHARSRHRLCNLTVLCGLAAIAFAAPAHADIV